jgi:hypothetical protein
VKTEEKACPSLEEVRTNHPTRRTSDVNSEYHSGSCAPRTIKRTYS